MYVAPSPRHAAWYAFRMRWKRRRFQARAFARRGELRLLRRGKWDRRAILLFATLRNEVERLPWFLKHYRNLGVNHFLFVDNDSDDGTRELLLEQPDTSVWGTAHSYRTSRFGLDWLNWLMLRLAVGHWCVVADADELLIYPHWQTRPLQALTEWLEASGQPAMAAMMLDLYPRGRLDAMRYHPGTDPLAVLEWFDAGNYTIRHNPLLDCLLMQGGVRARAFFAETPQRAPTLTKIPLLFWGRDCAWVNSTHSILPRRLNSAVFASDGGMRISGAMLHTKFLDLAVTRAGIEKARGEHFGNAPVFDDYYDAVMAAPDLWSPESTRFEGWQQLEALGLISRGGWA